MVHINLELDTFCVKQQPAPTEQQKRAQCYPGKHVRAKICVVAYVISKLCPELSQSLFASGLRIQP